MKEGSDCGKRKKEMDPRKTLEIKIVLPVTCRNIFVIKRPGMEEGKQNGGEGSSLSSAEGFGWEEPRSWTISQCPSRVAERVFMLWPRVRPVPLRWES